MADSTYTLIDADGRTLAINEREYDEIDPTTAISFWSVDGELYDLLPGTYTVLASGVERAAAFMACGEALDEEADDVNG